MNRGARGNAFGFRLKSLLNLSDTKSGKKRDYTLLHYIVETMDENSYFTKARNVTMELAAVYDAAKVSFFSAVKGLRKLGLWGFS